MKAEGTIRMDSPLRTLERTNKLVKKEGWEKEPAVIQINGKDYAEYWYCRKSEKILAKRTWWRLEMVNDIHSPLGLIGSKEDWVMRFLGYVPILGVASAVQNLIRSGGMIFFRIIKNQNSVSILSTEKDTQNSIIKRIRTVHQVDLGVPQRLVILGLSLALMVRAVGEALMLGLLFLPFDLVTNQYLEQQQRKTALNSA